MKLLLSILSGIHELWPKHYNHHRGRWLQGFPSILCWAAEERLAGDEEADADHDATEHSSPEDEDVNV